MKFSEGFDLDIENSPSDTITALKFYPTDSETNNNTNNLLVSSWDSVK